MQTHCVGWAGPPTLLGPWSEMRCDKHSPLSASTSCFSFSVEGEERKVDGGGGDPALQ